VKKINSDILSKCDATNCCMDELVVLPLNGETGFEEYYEHKAKEIVKAKKIFSPLEQNMLMLAYPHQDAKEPYVFERFFESATIVAKNHEFEGCFAIDISAYIGKENHEYFSRLISYMHQNRNAVFLLFMYSDNTNEINSMFENLSRFSEIRKLEIPLPTAKQLTEYTVSKIRDFSLHVKNPVYNYIQKFYSQNKFGYDTADFLVRQLKNAEYQGDHQMLKDIFENYVSSNNGKASMLGYGY